MKAEGFIKNPKIVSPCSKFFLESLCVFTAILSPDSKKKQQNLSLLLQDFYLARMGKNFKKSFPNGNKIKNNGIFLQKTFPNGNVFLEKFLFYAILFPNGNDF